MNREQAAERLKGLAVPVSAEAAMDMAIEALEQESCEDAISRADVIDIINGGTSWANIFVDYNAYVDTFNRIEDLPSVTPAKPKNEWIHKDDAVFEWKCSECGSWQMQKSKFCPHCGAAMETKNENCD